MSQPDTNSQSITQDSLYSPLDDPFFLSPTDQPGLKLSETVLNGSNFRQWQRHIIQALLSKNKIGFVSGECSLPDKSNKRYNYTQSSKHLWSELVERFGQLNVLELYELKKELANIKQENASLLDYYGKIKGLWENIDHMDPVPQCSCGVMAKCTCNMLKWLVERETQSKLIQLLMGLHGGYEQVQSSLLSMEPLPPINRALGILQKIERQKSINDNNNSAVLESVAYAAKKRFVNHKPTKDNTKGKRSKDNSGQPNVLGLSGIPRTQCGKSNHKTEDCFQLQTCLFCEIKGHIIEHCYKFKAWKTKQAKKAANSAGTVNPATHKPANTAAACQNQDAEYAPVYGPISQNGSSQVSPDLVQGIVDSVMSKVLQALSEKASSSQSCDPNSQTFSHCAGISPPCSIVNYGFSFYKDWVIDTGASDHMTSDASILHDVINLPHPLFVALPDGTLKPVYRTGTVYLTKQIVLYGVLLIPDFKPNLLSVGKLISRSQLIFTLSNNTCLFQDPSSNTTIAIGKRTEDLYTLRISVIQKTCNTSSLCSSNAAQQTNVALFHSRLGHSSVEKLKHVNPVMMQGVNKMFCETCVLAKHHSLPFHRNLSHAKKCFDLVHMDLWGPYKQPDRTGAQSFLAILDYSRSTWTFLLQQKTQVPSLIISFINLVETQFNARIKVIRSDNGTEFFQSQCHAYFACLRDAFAVSIDSPRTMFREPSEAERMADLARASNDALFLLELEYSEFVRRSLAYWPIVRERKLVRELNESREETACLSRELEVRDADISILEAMVA
ncbi:uncharacterized protein LOC141628210 [Silene latifolia]|uniref:uncharacterized protein LOC141628210 n=1 Tax=Silene latifolia TaxID=37657 RepID=UPI003D77D88E